MIERKYWLDQKFCGDTQVAASDLMGFGVEEKDAQELMAARFWEGLGVVVEVCGGGVVTSALAKPDSLLEMGVGLGMVMGGSVLRWHFANKAGGMLRVMGQDVLNTLGDSLGNLSQAMADSGVGSREIRALESLPNDLYSSELSSYNLSRVDQYASSFVQAAILALVGRWDLGALVAASGPISDKLGDMYYKQSDLGRRTWTRLAIGANDIDSLKTLTEEHVKMTDKLNAFPLFKQLMIGVAYLSKMPSQVLMTMRAVGEGMSGLGGMLSKQRSRMAAAESVEKFKVVVDAVRNGPMILTDKRFHDHKASSKDPLKILNTRIVDGVEIRNFKVKLPNGEMSDLLPLTIASNRGEVVALRGKSGMGKTKMVLGMQQLLEHEGDVYFVKNGVGKSVHKEASLVDVRRKIVFKDPAGIREGAMLADLFKEPCLHENMDVYKQHVLLMGEKVAKSLWLGDLATVVKEYEDAKAGKGYAFDKKLLPTVLEVIQTRESYVNLKLQSLGGNMESGRVNARSVWDRSRLSQGEMNRLAVAISLAYVEAFDPELVVLDEPLDKLDRSNFDLQLDVMQRMIKRDKAPVLMVITHNHAQQLVDRFQAKVVCLDNENC